MQHKAIRPAEQADAQSIARMLKALTDEIIAETGAQHFNIDLAATEEQCRSFLVAGHYTVLLAESSAGMPIGFISLCPSYALYAEGAFAIIQELYVTIDHRNCGTGTQLLDAAFGLARSRGWRRLELCTPPLPQFERSVTFYERHGFQITGGRKMKWIP
jgi:GNAT superfamily N-acetyltransferase